MAYRTLPQLHLGKLLSGHSLELDESKDDIAETARLLAMNLAHYQSKFGDMPLEETLAVLNVDRPNESQLHLLVSGMENLVGVLGMVREGGLGVDGEVVH